MYAMVHQRGNPMSVCINVYALMCGCTPENCLLLVPFPINEGLVY